MFAGEKIFAIHGNNLSLGTQQTTFAYAFHDAQEDRLPAQPEYIHGIKGA